MAAEGLGSGRLKAPGGRPIGNEANEVDRTKPLLGVKVDPGDVVRGRHRRGVWPIPGNAGVTRSGPSSLDLDGQKLA